ncbi:hypothetical protein [Aquimarina algiphila]|uniref:Uncharacterized protein n=1 Tax=Aquimarina algiphila TaxID=2047982 RepID=A0A554VRM6_9FLAO|nr:hypothetical protein [Aquimarina algiphila]TSE11302.1 hypothetical protein FOF46_01340 [Aquimarina algiphila]
MTIVFKNRDRVEISVAIAKILKEKIIKGEAKTFQIFSDENDNPIFFINLSEIAYIAASKTEENENKL